MPLLPSFVNPATKLKELRQNIQTDTNISNFQSDSKMNAIISPLADEISQAYSATRAAFDANSVNYATGRDLDAIARRMGVERRSATFAYASEQTRIVAFYPSSGTFGSINGGADINLSGVTIRTNQIEGGGVVGIQYKVTDKVLPAASSLAYVEVTALYSGAASNVGKGSLIGHDFTNYTGAGNNSLKVINFQPILNGSNLETDDLLKYRLSRLHASRMQIADDRIFLRSIRAPGVVDVRVADSYYGIGTVGVFVLGAENQSTSDMVLQVQQQLNPIVAPGMELIATAATEVAFDIDMDIFFTRPVNQNIKDRVTLRIKQQIREHMRRQGLGATVDLPALASELRTDLSDIIIIGVRNNPAKAFNTVDMRRGLSNGVMSEKERLIAQSITLEDYEYPTMGSITLNFN